MLDRDRDAVSESTGGCKRWRVLEATDGRKAKSVPPQRLWRHTGEPRTLGDWVIGKLHLSTLRTKDRCNLGLHRRFQIPVSSCIPFPFPVIGIIIFPAAIVVLLFLLRFLHLRFSLLLSLLHLPSRHHPNIDFSAFLLPNLHFWHRLPP